MKELFTPLGLVSLFAIWLLFMAFRKFKFASAILMLPTIAYLANSGFYSVLLGLGLMVLTYVLYRLLLISESDSLSDRIYWSSLIGSIIMIGGIQYYQKNFLFATGLSLLVFQSFGWLSDTYYGRLTYRVNLVNFTSYFLYFPKFISGPIETTQSFLPQLSKINASINSENIKKALHLIILGCFKKFVIADNLINDSEVYGQNLDWNAPMVLWFSLVHFIKIYADFSGLIDIVRGISVSFGFTLKKNFNYPFAAISFKDYWGRWNMSLSNWVLENLFKPISFQLRGALGKLTGVFALVISFGVISMWHGLTWNYAIFGLFHVVGLLLENLLKLEWVKNKSNLISTIQRLFFILVLGFITLFFNNYLISDTLQLFGYFGNIINSGALIENLPLIVFSICLVLILFLIERIHARNASPIVSVLLLILVVLMWPEEAKTFIYEF
jgi:alginate O-acetyltransferase complex protein AlgI